MNNGKNERKLKKVDHLITEHISSMLVLWQMRFLAKGINPLVSVPFNLWVWGSKSARLRLASVNVLFTFKSMTIEASDHQRLWLWQLELSRYQRHTCVLHVFEGPLLFSDSDHCLEWRSTKCFFYFWSKQSRCVFGCTWWPLVFLWRKRSDFNEDLMHDSWIKRKEVPLNDRFAVYCVKTE